MNDTLKVLLGMVLLCIVPIGCLAIAWLLDRLPFVDRLLDRLFPLPDHDKDAR